jgi:CRP/FNR family cyclic AMP-dependent transcriptional regulator
MLTRGFAVFLGQRPLEAFVSARSSEAMFSELPLFAQLEDISELQEVLALATPFCVDAGVVLFRQGDESDGMYLIVEGEVVVRARVPGDTEAELGRVGPGGVLGELALIDRGLRSATVQARIQTTGFFFSEQFFKMLRLAQRVSALKVMQPICRVIAQRVRDRVSDLAAATAVMAEETAIIAHIESTDPPVVERPAHWANYRQQRVNGLIADRLRLMSFFRRFNANEVSEILAHGSVVDAQRGQVLWRRGELSTRSYVVVRGALQLSIQGEVFRELCMVLGPGQLVGTVSLMDSGPQPMDCVVREPSWLWEADVETLRRILSGTQGISYKLFDATVESLVDQLRRVTRAVARVTAQGRAVAAGCVPQTSTSTVLTNP